jgi:radical SAM superfamily enzyme YgiQ (UPF0313 family)
MKVLLVKPRYFEQKHQSVWRAVHAPLGLAYLAAVARKNGYDVKILDMEALEMNEAQFKNCLIREKPDVVGINILTPIFENARICAKIVKEVLPNAKIVAGGCHAFLLPEEILRKIPEVDFVLRGEAEFTFLKLLNYIKKNKRREEFRKIDGIAFRLNNNFFVSEKIPRIENLDSLPTPAFDLLPISLYFEPIMFAKKTMMFMTSRGCPYRCIFCEEPIIYGHKVRSMSPKKVVKEMKNLVENFGVDYIRIDDSTFNFDIRRVEKICELLLKEKVKVKWRVKARVDKVTERMIAKMKKAGCVMISFGVESANQSTLNFLKKGYTIEQVKRAFEITKKYGIKTLGFFMIGLPNEKRKDIYNTIQFAKKLNPDFVEFTIPVPLPGSELYNLLKNRLITKNWSEFYQWRCVFKHPYLTPSEILRWYKRAYKQFYLRPAYILKRLKSIRSLRDVFLNLKYSLFFLKNLEKK